MIYVRCIRNLFSKKNHQYFSCNFAKKTHYSCHVVLKLRELCVNYFNSRLDPMTFKVDLTICRLCVSSCTSWTALAGQRPTTGCYVRGSSYTGCWSRLSRGRKRWYIITSLDGVNTYTFKTFIIFILVEYPLILFKQFQNVKYMYQQFETITGWFFFGYPFSFKQL